MIKIITEGNEAAEFAAWLEGKKYGGEKITASVEPAGRHTAGRTVVSGYDGDEEEMLRTLWDRYCME